MSHAPNDQQQSRLQKFKFRNGMNMRILETAISTFPYDDIPHISPQYAKCETKHYPLRGKQSKSHVDQN